MSPNHDPTNNRPPTISELAERAQQDLYDPSLPLKHWLRTAEAHKRAAEDAEDNRDLETAFMEYVKATTLVVDKIPSHSEYRTVLNSLQRKNLGLVSEHPRPHQMSLCRILCPTCVHLLPISTCHAVYNLISLPPSLNFAVHYPFAYPSVSANDHVKEGPVQLPICLLMQ